MKIQIDNFGPIRRFECDLDKDLHLILGTNNIGKSYAITVVYLLLKSFMEAGEEFDPFEDMKYVMGAGMDNELFDHMVEQMGEENPDIKKAAVDRTFALLKKGFLKQFQRHFDGTYGSIDAVGNRFSGEEPIIRLLFHEFDIDIGTDRNAFKLTQMNIRMDLESIYKGIVGKFEQISGDLLAARFAKLGHGMEEHGEFTMKYSIAARMFYGHILSEVLKRIHAILYLPASRSGLYPTLSTFGQIFAELAKSRSFLKGGIELPGIAVPVSDYFLELSQIDPNKKREQDDPIQRIAKDIENDILNGKVEFDTKTRKLFYTPDDAGGLRLDMDATSSMVSEVSPIVSFLRHVVSKPARLSKEAQEAGITPKHLLFIEEPEAHLHPENQVRLMAAFAALANAGVKVMITTHSDFLFNKLNNLILEKSIDTAAVSAMLFKQTDEGGEAVPLAMDDLGIEDENFIDATERLYDEKVDLIDRMNRDGDDGDAE
uniref:AAA ATPase domain-containing protein n=1 Tax=Candidatus Kentrum sp. TC TaxID=2126339 RepID=A0A450YBR8_9GAMM|nr:MAG: AAA ATPase domain-containing protein [Candidatus Kentron sp. TC]